MGTLVRGFSLRASIDFVSSNLAIEISEKPSIQHLSRSLRRETIYLKMAREYPRHHRFIGHPANGSGRLAVIEEHQSGKGVDAITLCCGRVFVDIEPKNPQAIAILARHGLDRGLHLLAVPAPGRPKLHQHRGS